MSAEAQKPEENQEVSATENQESPQETASPTSQNNKTINTLVAIILVLLAVIVGGALYMITKDDTPGKSKDMSSSSSSNESSSRKTTPRSEPLQTGIQTEYRSFEVDIDSMKFSSNSVVVNFSLVCAQPDKGSNDTECYTGDIWDVRTSNDVLATAYFIDDEAQQKYEIVKDANGKPVASKVGPQQQYVKKGEKVNYYVTLTKPPKDATVTLYLPKIQPVSGLKITK